MPPTTSRRLMLLGAVALLAGCATTPATVGPAAAYEELEPVFAVSSAYEAISIRVSSNGCTTRGDFTFYVERRDGGAAVAFARTRPDNCRSFARGYAEIVFPFAELGVAPETPLFVLNPFERWYGPGSVDEARGERR